MDLSLNRFETGYIYIVCWPKYNGHPKNCLVCWNSRCVAPITNLSINSETTPWYGSCCEVGEYYFRLVHILAICTWGTDPGCNSYLWLWISQYKKDTKTAVMKQVFISYNSEMRLVYIITHISNYIEYLNYFLWNSTVNEPIRLLKWRIASKFL